LDFPVDISAKWKYNELMKTLMVQEFKRDFEKVFAMIKEGEEVTIRSNKKKEKIAVLMPFEHYCGFKGRKLGILESKASFSLKENFKMTDSELLSS